MQALAKAGGEVGFRAGGGLEFDPAGGVAGEAENGLDLVEEEHVALLADQFDDGLEAGVDLQLAFGEGRGGGGHHRATAGGRMDGREARGVDAAAARRGAARHAAAGGRAGAVLQFPHQRFRVGQVGDMGQADHRHLGGHHRVRGQRHLFDGFQQHLPHPRQRAHRQAGGHVLTARLFVGWGGRVFGSGGVDLDDGNPVGDFRQIAQHRHRIGPVGILRGKFGKGRGGIALHDQVEEVERAAPVGEAQHGADLVAGGLSGTVRDGLVHQAHRVADRAFGGAGDQGESVGG